MTLRGLGPDEATARLLLEEHLIDVEGHRALITEAEATMVLPAGMAGTLLDKLEREAVLRAEQHQGTRVFELGHDSLAEMVKEGRDARRREDQERKARELAKQARAQRAAEAKRRRLFRGVMGLSIVTSALVVAVGLAVWGQASARKSAKVATENADEAKRQSEVATENANEAGRQEERARAVAIRAAVQEQLARDQTAFAANLLLEHPDPEHTPEWTNLAMETLLSEIPLVTLRGHRGQVISAEVDRASEHLLTASYDGTARIWRLDGRGEPTVLEHTHRVTSAAFSPSGKRVVTTSWDRTARVWNVESGENLVTFVSERPIINSVMSAAFSPDERFLAIASGKLLMVRDLVQKRWIRQPVREGVRSVTFSQQPGARRLVILTWSGLAFFWDLDRTAEPRQVPETDGEVSSIRFSPDGSKVVSTTTDGVLRIWSADDSGKSLELQLKQKLDGAVISPKNSFLVTWSGDSLSIRSLADEFENERQLSGHTAKIVSAMFSADEKLVLTTSFDGTARLWGTGDSRLVAVFRGHLQEVTAGTFSGSGRVVTATADGDVRIWGNDEVWQPIALVHGDVVNFAEFDASGTRVVTASDDESVRVWSADGEEIARGEFDDAAVLAKFDPDETLAIATVGEVFLAEIDGRNLIRNEELRWRSRDFFDRRLIRYAEPSRDGSRVVVTTTGEIAKILQVDGSGLLELEGHSRELPTASFSPDGERVVSASADGRACVYDLADAFEPSYCLQRAVEPSFCLEGHGGAVYHAEFSLDGTKIVTASGDWTARVWDATSGTQTTVFRGHQGVVSTARFSPDGRRVVTASSDATVQVWSSDDAAREALIIPVPDIDRSQPNRVIVASFDPSGRRIVTASIDGVARIWDIGDLTIERLEAALREATLDCLPPEFRTRYLGETSGQAKSKYEACERSYDRKPFFSE